MDHDPFVVVSHQSAVAYWGVVVGCWGVATIVAILSLCIVCICFTVRFCGPFQTNEENDGSHRPLTPRLTSQQAIDEAIPFP